MNHHVMQLSTVEPAFERYRFLLRPIASTVKQRMTRQNRYPLAQEIAMAQLVSLHSLHCLCLRDTSKFCGLVLFLGASTQVSPCLPTASVLIDRYTCVLSTWCVKMSCLEAVRGSKRPLKRDDFQLSLSC